MPVVMHCMFKTFRRRDSDDSYFRIHVFTDNPSVCIGRPRDLRTHHLTESWGDFQSIANENQCSLIVQQGKSTTYYEPKQTRPTAPVQPVPKQKSPVITRNTNARGASTQCYLATLWKAVQHDEKNALQYHTLDNAEGKPKSYITGYVWTGYRLDAAIEANRHILGGCFTTSNRDFVAYARAER